MKYKLDITDKEVIELIKLLTDNIAYAKEALKKTPTDSDDSISLYNLIEQNACEKGKWEGAFSGLIEEEEERPKRRRWMM